MCASLDFPACKLRLQEQEQEAEYKEAEGAEVGSNRLWCTECLTIGPTKY